MTEDYAPDLVAAIDIGSNSFHMIVARHADGQLKVLDRLREPVRLAAGLDPERRIAPAAEQRALACLERFGQRLRGIDPAAARAVGTNALRRARNARDFLERAERALGHGIEVVSGIEEARLIYLGVAHSLADDGQPRLVVDIGGGSTELIVGRGFTPSRMESLHMGCVSTTQQFFADGQLSRRAWDAAALAAHQELEPVASRFREHGWRRAVGSSGTIKAVGGALRDLGIPGHEIDLVGLRRLRDLLLKDGKLDRARLKSIGEDRADVFAGGVAVLLAVFEALGLERMEVADGALREGVLYDILGRIHDEDVRGATVNALSARYHVDRAQAERVRATAAECLRQVAKAWHLADDARARTLDWAAALHEIGMDISHSQYHKHGGYVLWHADMAGFSRDDQQLIAVLVRAHRRKFPVDEFKELPERLAQPAKRLAVLLRLAVLIHRGRSNEHQPPFDLAVTDKGLRLRFPAGWLELHPLLRGDLEQEAEFLKAAGLELKF